MILPRDPRTTQEKRFSKGFQKVWLVLVQSGPVLDFANFSHLTYELLRRIFRSIFRSMIHFWSTCGAFLIQFWFIYSDMSRLFSKPCLCMKIYFLIHFLIMLFKPNSHNFGSLFNSHFDPLIIWLRSTFDPLINGWLRSGSKISFMQKSLLSYYIGGSNFIWSTSIKTQAFFWNCTLFQNAKKCTFKPDNAPFYWCY